jgi:threonine/homoserine/homoserine lactone efflux protein
MLGAIANALLHRVPGFWLVVGIGVAFAMYALLAGIGVAVYRTLDSGKARA